MTATVGGVHPDTVAAIRQLTVRWVEALAPEGSTVASAAGAWPLLALLEYAAAGPARDELIAAVGLPPERAGAAAVGLLADLDAEPELSAALGIWTDRLLTLTPEFSDLVPKAHRGVLSGEQDADQAELDRWAHERTHGLIERMPITVDSDTRLALATALTLKTEWQRPFDEGQHQLGGPDLRWLHRIDSNLDHVRVVDGSLTLARIAGAGSIDVLLAIGEPDAQPAAVLTAAVAAEPDSGVAGSSLTADEPGPGLRTERGRASAPLLFLGLPAFDVRSTHDLLEHAKTFGLVTAQDNSRGHFPGLSTDPLAIGQANQETVARFHAAGFDAASVTAMAMMAGSVPPPPQRVRNLYLSLDRPFGFVAVHRPTGLPLFVGWAAEDSWVRWSNGAS